MALAGGAPRPAEGVAVTLHLGAGDISPFSLSSVNPMTTPLLESVSDILAKPNPKWLVRHILPVPGLTLLYGPSGQGKSFVALDWALSVASKTPWLDTYPVDVSGTAVYIACEGTGGLK